MVDEVSVDIEQLQAENLAKFFRDGPRLRYDYHVWVVVKDSEQDMVMLGGLGGLGVGKMWVSSLEAHRAYPGFDEAPERTCPPPEMRL